MPDIALAAEVRSERGSPSSRRSRTEGRVPAVIYGHGAEPVAITVDARELRVALAAQSGGSVLFNVKVGSTDHLVIARDIQRHPVRHTVAHVDFQTVSRDEVISTDVPVHLVGEALRVTRGGGVVEHALLSLHVFAKPADVPSAIEVDIEGLQLGDAIRVSDLKLPSGVTTDVDPETPVVVGAAPRGSAEGAEGGAEIVEAATAEASSEAETSEDEASAES